MTDAHRLATIRHLHLQPTRLNLPLPIHRHRQLSHNHLLTMILTALIRDTHSRLLLRCLAVILLHSNQPQLLPATILAIHHRPLTIRHRLLLHPNHRLLHMHRLRTMANRLHPLHRLLLHNTTIHLHPLQLRTLPCLHHNSTRMRHHLPPLHHRLPLCPLLLQLGRPMVRPASLIRCLPTSTRCTAHCPPPLPARHLHSHSPTPRNQQHQPRPPRTSMRHSPQPHTGRTEPSYACDTDSHSLDQHHSLATLFDHTTQPTAHTLSRSLSRHCFSSLSTRVAVLCRLLSPSIPAACAHPQSVPFVTSATRFPPPVFDKPHVSCACTSVRVGELTSHRTAHWVA